MERALNSLPISTAKSLVAQDNGQRDGRSAMLQRAPLVRPQGYLRAAQAYILISIPTATSMIFGAFQVMYFLFLVVTDHLSVRATTQKLRGLDSSRSLGELTEAALRSRW
jgi:hypothetical protein